MIFLSSLIQFLSCLINFIMELDLIFFSSSIKMVTKGRLGLRKEGAQGLVSSEQRVFKEV